MSISYRKRAADVAAMLENNPPQHPFVRAAPGTMWQSQTGQHRAHYLIEYCLISNDQLLGCSLPVPGFGTRNSLVHPVR
jgi:hypothetical protein